MTEKTYIAIDLKSFYASVECIERKLDPLTTNLVVADESRTNKTICLAVSPSLKAYGIPGRPRLFEVVQRIAQLNAERKMKAPRHLFTGSSADAQELASSAQLSIDYIVARPRMAFYIDYSTRIYNIYLRYVSAVDIHVYSIDEVFMDATAYLKSKRINARDFCMQIILDVIKETGITATAGIGTNLYLSKIAMDIQAKHIAPDENGVRIAELDEMSYRRLLWSHRPLKDFWRIGHGYAKKLESVGLFTMGDIARCSLGAETDYYNEDLLYKLFGINAELLIDHAWGWEPCTIEDIKAYKPDSNSIGSGQVLSCGYSFEKARLIVREMAEALALDLVDKHLVTDQIMLNVCYDSENLNDSGKMSNYKGDISTDYYGRSVPKAAHTTVRLSRKTSSARLISEAVLDAYKKIVNKDLLVRRVYVTASNVMDESRAEKLSTMLQLDLFTDVQTLEAQQKAEAAELEREKKQQKAMLEIKKKFGKNAILKASDLEEGATTAERNQLIGGHKA